MQKGFLSSLAVKKEKKEEEEKKKKKACVALIQDFVNRL